MELRDMVLKFIQHPFPLWESELTELLVQNKWKELNQIEIFNHNYSTCGSLYKHAVEVTKCPIVGDSEHEIIYLESPDFKLLGSFYEEHGLNPYLEKEIQATEVLEKLKSAMTEIKLIPQAVSCISKLVRSIQVLKQDDPEIDMSYSHPKVPFSIFVSVCENNSVLSNLRVAESILHEAMHLKLTLIEGVVPLVKPFTGNLYYSPWRDEGRPAQGVLHGLFVFKALKDFYSTMPDKLNFNMVIKDFLSFRIEEINRDMDSLNDFYCNPDLTEEGVILVSKLL